MNEGTSLSTETEQALPPTSFDELYGRTRGELYRALATVTDDRDLSTEAIDVGFTRWRRKLRKPSDVPGAVGVMALAFKWAHRQLGNSAGQPQGFRLADQNTSADTPLLDRFAKLSLDERAVLVMRSVLGWSDEEIGHAVDAQGVAAAARAVVERLESEGYSYEQLAVALRERAATFNEPLSRLDAVKAKGTMQRVGAFAGGAVLTAGLVGGVATVVGNQTDTPEPTPGNGTVASGAVQGLTAENAMWQRVPAQVGDVMAVAHDGTDFFLLAHDNQGRATMMQSATGLDWATLPAPGGGDRQMWFQQIVATPDLLVAVGQAFDDRRGRDSAAVFITEDKEIWTRADLPVDDTLEVGGELVNLHTWIGGVDIGPNGFTVMGNQSADFDPERIIEDLVDPELLRHGWGTDERGMQFFDNEGRVVERLSWEEIGLDPELVTLISGGRSVVFTSEDGIEWTPSEEPTPAGAHGIGALASTTNMQAALTHGNRGTSVWIRRGSEWERPDLDASLTTMTSWNDQILVAGRDNTTGQPGMWTSADGTNWERTEIPLGEIHNMVASTEGIVAIGSTGGPQTLGPAEIEVDDLLVRATSDGRFIVVDSEGNTVVEIFEEDVVYADQITINDPDTGEVVVQFDDRALEQAWEAIYRDSEFRGEQQTQAIMFSYDGINWTTLESEDPDFHPNTVALGNDAILVFGWSEGNNFLGLGGGGGPQLYLIGPGS